MKRNMQWQVLALAVGLVLSAKASAQNIERHVSAGDFGSVGQIVIADDLYGKIGYRSGPGDAFFISLTPAADYFLKENLSLGGFVTLSTSFQSGPDPLTVGLGVRAGYNIPLNQTVSMWPRLGLAVVHDTLGVAGSDSTFLQISLTAPFLVHLAPHFFVGGGPGLVTQLGSDTVATLQVSTIVGGYF